ncbi:MAG: hypothetical protein MZV49_00310 [Rhodopseudomonas palustris]|nr:hypothetical protein [Rhodopseudomonas palustris]
MDHLASIHRAGASWIFRLGEEDAAATAVDRVMTLDGGGSATIRLDTQKFPAHLHGYPLAYPLEDLLFRHLLADRRAVLVHACGVAWEGARFLFVGASGAGKSAPWRVCGAPREPTILNDDRIVLEAAGDRVLIHPTPWSGDMPEVGGGPTPLAGLYFLRQGTPIRFEPVRPATAVGLLYAKSFPPLGPRADRETLETLEAACRHAPCSWLMVPPDPRAVAWVQGRP